MGFQPPYIPGQSYVPGSVSGITHPYTRRNVLVLGGEGDQGPVTPTNSDVCQRYGFTIAPTGGVPINRFRIRIQNVNAATNAFTGGAINFTEPIQIGTPNVASENQWNGDFVASSRVTVVPTPGSQTLGAASEYVSPWVSPSGFNLKPGTFYGLTLGFTCAGVQVNMSHTPGWAWVGTGSATASAADAAPGTTPLPYTQYLDVRLEYEYNATNQIGLFIGDSITSGWLNTITGLGTTGTGHMGPDNTWPSMAGLRLGHHAMNAGIGGASASSGTGANHPFTTNTNWAYQRFLSPESALTAFACTPDYAVLQLGVNDSLISTGITLANYQSAMQSIISILQGFGINRIYAVTSSSGFSVNTTGTTPAWQGGVLSAQPASPMTNMSLYPGIAAAIGGASLFYPGPPGPVVSGNLAIPPGASNAWFAASGGPWTCYLGTPQAPVGGPYTVSGITSGGGGSWPLIFTVSGTPARPAQALVGCPVLTSSEYNRQNFNLWLRTNPPGLQAVIDFDAWTTTQFFYPTVVGRPEYYNSAGDVHPTTCAMYEATAALFANSIQGN